MPDRQILLPLETTLRMQIAMLQRDLAHLQAQLLQMTADQQQQQTVATLLAAAQIVLPVPLTQCRFDAEHGCLTFDNGLDEGEGQA